MVHHHRALCSKGPRPATRLSALFNTLVRSCTGTIYWVSASVNKTRFDSLFSITHHRMPLSAPFPIRHRRKFSRSHNGCLGCRSRRKKCDGDRPTCGLCTRRGIECEWPGEEKKTQASNEELVATANEERTLRNLVNDRDYLDNRLAIANNSRPHSQLTTTVLSPQAMRGQIRAVSATFFGPDEHSRAFSPLWVMLNRLTEINDSFTYALDALMLAQLGTIHVDRRLLDQATRSYFFAIWRLQKELDNAVTATTIPDTTLSTPYILFMCGHFNLVPLMHSNANTTTHLLGWGRMLFSKPEPLTTMRRMLIHCFYAYLLEWSILRRQDPFSDIPDFTRLIADSQPGYCTGILQHTIKTPCLVQRADRVLSSGSLPGMDRPNSSLETSAVLLQLQQHEKNIRSYIQIWSAVESPTQHTIVDTSALSSHDQHLDLLSATIFGTAFLFPSFAAAQFFKNYWQQVHLIVDTQHRLQRSRRASSDSVDPVIHPHVAQLADDICRTIIYLCAATVSGSHGYYCASGAIQYIRPWFSSHQQHHKVAWCDAVWTFLQAKHITITAPDA